MNCSGVEMERKIGSPYILEKQLSERVLFGFPVFLVF